MAFDINAKPEGGKNKICAIACRSSTNNVPSVPFSSQPNANTTTTKYAISHRYTI